MAGPIPDSPQIAVSRPSAGMLGRREEGQRASRNSLIAEAGMQAARLAP